MMWRFWCLLVTYVIVSNADLDPPIVCPTDLDCVVNCSPITRNCYNTNIVCPKSNNSLTYNCTVNCLGTFSCMGTVIESTNAVSVLTVQSLSPYGCQNVDIRANATENVVLICEGAQACARTNVTSMGGTSFVLSSTNGTNGDTSGFYSGMLNISNTQNVDLTCYTWGCTGSAWTFDNVENLDMKCFNYTGCAGNNIAIAKATDVTIEVAIGTYYALWQNHINIFDVENLIIAFGDGVEARGWFSLYNIENFLLDVGNVGNTFLTWTVQNVSNVALNSWNATSYWIVDGMPIQSRYQCPNGRDCNIRVDANLSATSLTSLPVICPTDLVSQPSGSKTTTTCRFYCTSASSSCSIVDLTVKDITNSAIYINASPFVAPFSVNASALGLKNANTTMNITCGYANCCKSTLVVSGYDYVNIAALGMFAFANSTFNVSGFSNLTATLNAQALDNTILTLTDGGSVSFQSYLGSNEILAGSNWKFNNIERVAIDCLESYDCLDAKFESIDVGEVSMVCGVVGNYLQAGLFCQNTVVKQQDSSLHLTCQGMFDACSNMIIYYSESKSDETSFTMYCVLNPDDETNCQNISIHVLDNKRGFDAISFLSDAYTWSDVVLYSAYVDVTVYCGDDGTQCHCHVKYDYDKGWYCDGECGTETCPAGDKWRLIYIIGGVILGILLILIGIGIYLRKKYCAKHGFQPLIDGTKNNYTY